MITLPTAATRPFPYYTTHFWIVLLLAAVFSFMAAIPKVERQEITLLAHSKLRLWEAVAMGLASSLLLLLSTMYIVGSSFNPFTYFRF